MEVHEVFDNHAKDYDKERRDLIPCFDDFYGIAIDVIDINKYNPKVLDLGAGTGLLSLFLLEKYPNAKVTLIDLADNMLNQARIRFKDNHNIVYINDNYITHDFDSKFDIIISSLSIHHLSHEDKFKLYDKYVHLLNDGGVFVNADLLLDEDSAVETFFFKKTDDIVLEKITQESFEKANKRRKYDNQETVNYQLDCLKKSGCKQVGLPYKFYNYGVLWGKK